MRTITIVGLFLLLSACASSHDVDQLRRSVHMTDQELGAFKTETSQKMAGLSREMESIRKQMFTMTASTDEKEDKTRTIMGRLDELQHQLDTYWKETKNELAAAKRGGAVAGPSKALPAVKDAREEDAEAPYKEAFDLYQKGLYRESVDKFTAFVQMYPKSSLAPNALYWLADSNMMLKDYDKAILSFQELLDKYPKTEMAPKALLSQADAFRGLNDKKSSMTILKKVMELYPKSEEAAIAERKLRGLNL